MNYLTYDKSGRVTKHRFLFFAVIRAKKNKGFVDIFDKGVTRSIRDYRIFKGVKR